MTELGETTPTAPYGAFIAILAVLVCVGFFAAHPLPGVTNDVTQIVDVAQNIAAGNGISTDSLYYTEHFATGRMPAPQTVFPPGQSFLISLAIRSGFDPIAASRLIAAIGFLVIPNVLFVVCLRAGVNTQVAVATSILWLCMILAWANTLSGKSDIPFMGLTMLSTLFLVRTTSPIRNAFLAGIFAAFALSFRYAGLFFMTAVGITLVIEWIRTRTRHAFVHLCAFSIPSGSTAMLIFWRNFNIVGDIKGGNNYAVNKAVTDIVRNFYRAISSMMGLDYARLPSGSIGEWLLLIALFLGVILLMKSSRPVRTAISRAGSNRAVFLSLVYPLFTIFMLLILEMQSQPGSRDRMFMAMMPFAFCFVAKLLQGDGTTSRLKIAFAVVGILSFLLGQANVAEERFNTPRHDHHWYRMNQLLNTEMEDGPTVKEFLQEQIT
ncbi:MAG: hypothetical protein AB8G99_06525, partial [Planctomycetaceae bacterium]